MLEAIATRVDSEGKLHNDLNKVRAKFNKAIAAAEASSSSMPITLGSKDCINTFVKSPLVADKRVKLEHQPPPAQRAKRIRGSAKPWWVVQG